MHAYMGTVLVGKKPKVNYVVAVVTQFNSGEKEVEIRARGRAISKAVDVAEYVRKRLMPDVKLKSIEIGTETMQGKDNKPVNVSVISIVLSK